MVCICPIINKYENSNHKLYLMHHIIIYHQVSCDNITKFAYCISGELTDLS